MVPEAPIILELFGTVMNGNSGSPTKEFVVCGFVGILKSAPSAHVVNLSR